jgi:hypothetical protein
MTATALSDPGTTIPRGVAYDEESAMQQVGQLQQGGRLGPRFARLLLHRRAAWWFTLLAVAGATQFLSFFVIGTTIAYFEGLGHERGQVSRTQILISIALSVVVALAVTIYVHQKQKETFFDPPRDRVPRKRWHWFATKNGAVVALDVAYTTFLMWLFLLVGLVALARLVNPLLGLPGHPLLWLVPVPAALALWAFVAWRHVALDVLKTAEPPELRLAANLRQQVDAFQERAQALEDAFEEAAAISRKVQHGIELDQEQLGKLREQYRFQTQLIELSDRAPTVRTVIAQENARSARWGLLINVVIALVFWVIGLLTDALIDTEALGDQLRQWFSLG